MSLTEERGAGPALKTVHPFIDVDVHNSLGSPEVLRPYLATRWHRDFFGDGGLGIASIDTGRTVITRMYNASKPRVSLYREDGRPPNGLQPGSDLEFMTRNYLDAWPVEKAILAPLDSNAWPRFGALADALSSAYNDWLLEEWLTRDSRLYGAIAIPTEDPLLAAREIARMARHPRFVQVEINVNTRDPMGHARYWPIYEAAAAAGLPMSVHVGSAGSNPVTGAGWPSYLFEYHASYPIGYQAQITSLIASGVFRAFPALKMVMVEGAFAWIGPLLARLDRAWRLIGAEATHIDRLPSDIVREHVWFSTQPVDEPTDPVQFREMLDHLDHIGFADRVMFSTDYPHFDFDSPELAFPPIVSGDLKDRIFRRNAAALFRFEADADPK